MTEENNITVLKRADEGAYKDTDFQVKTAMKAGDGVIVMQDENQNENIEVKATTDNNTTVVADKVTNFTSVHAPDNTDEEEAQMEEVSYEDYIKSKQVAINSPNAAESENPTKRVQAIIGQSADAAKKVLDDMMDKKQIASFRFIPIGMPFSMEIEPGRVQVLCDASRKVIDVSIS